MVSLSFQTSWTDAATWRSPKAQKPSLVPCVVSFPRGVGLGLLQILNEWIVKNVGARGDFGSLLFMAYHTDGETEAQRAEPVWEPPIFKTFWVILTH